MQAKWFAPCVAYTMAKYGMSMCVLGMAEEFRGEGIAVNALWPRTIIATAALQIIPGADRSRADASQTSWPMPPGTSLTRDSRTATGNFFIDEEVLAAAGITDFEICGIPRHALARRLFPGLSGAGTLPAAASQAAFWHAQPRSNNHPCLPTFIACVLPISMCAPAAS